MVFCLLNLVFSKLIGKNNVFSKCKPYLNVFKNKSQILNPQSYALFKTSVLLKQCFVFLLLNVINN